MQIFDDLDLSTLRGIAPLDFCGGAVADIDRFQFRIKHITGGSFDLTQIIAAIGQSLVGVDIAILIGHILPDGIVIAVIEQKHRAVNSLAGGLVHLVEQDSGNL